MNLVIVNRYDSPSEEMIASDTNGDGFFGYIHPDLKNDKRYRYMMPSNPTPLEDFGIRTRIEDGVLHGELVDPCRATYPDGRPRRWQGSTKFSFPL